MADDWDQVMQEASFIALLHGIEFSDLRNAWGQQEIERDPEFYEGHGVTSSDMNHMLYGAMKGEKYEVEALAERLGKARRVRLGL